MILVDHQQYDFIIGLASVDRFYEGLILCFQVEMLRKIINVTSADLFYEGLILRFQIELPWKINIV